MCSTFSTLVVNILTAETNSVATGSSHPDYPGYLGHFLSRSEWVSPGHAYIPDPDQKLFSYYVHQNLQ